MVSHKGLLKGFLGICLLLIRCSSSQDAYPEGAPSWAGNEACNCNGYSARCYFDEELYQKIGHGGHCMDCSHNRAGPNCEPTIESRFVRGEERWQAWELTGKDVDLLFNPAVKSIGVEAEGRDTVYFRAPNRFLGNQRSSYNHDLTFSLRIGELGPQSGSMDIILEGAGLTVSTTIFAQGNSLPSTQTQEYRFRLHEDGKFGWSPRLSSRNFMALLSNLTAIKIRGTYTYDGKGFLDNVKLDTTRLGQFGDPATWVETCTCPEGYVGQFCESCAAGYRHSPPNGGPFASCIPCDCNNHATICDSETGQCICQHNTDGNQCERCARGYYGNALKGTPEDCQPCPCPNGGACLTLLDESVVCLECPEGYTGPRCELCTDGYFGDPQGRHGAPRPCEKCDCNGNIDSNAVSNCNRTTGECLKCIYNTGGFYCDQCLPGFYGDALALPKGDCRPCRCNFYGTVPETYGPPVCDQISGQCNCKPYVTGRTCDVCEDGFWNLTSGTGCQQCDCDSIGSESRVCDKETGQCDCRNGVVGRGCDTCEPYHYGFSTEGCSPCDCDTIGSLSLQCDATGQCLCRENVEGRRCDRCRENTYDKQAGCRDCPACYTLVLDAVSVHRERLAELERLLSDIISNPTVLNDIAFEDALNSVMADVDQLWNDAQAAATSGGEATVEQHLKDLQDRISKVRGLLQDIKNFIEEGEHYSSQGERNVTEAEMLISNARDALRDAQIYLDVEGNRALDKAVDRSNQFGQQSARMSEIAREARQLADKQEDDAKSITQLAYDARNISHDAHNLARKAIEDQNNITQVIKGIESQIESLANRHNAILKEASASLGEAKAVYKEALNLSTEASSIAIAPLNATGLREHAVEIEEEAQRLKDEIEKLMNDRQDLFLDLQSQLTRTEDLIRKGQTQEQKTADLLTSAESLTHEAQGALRGAESDAKGARDIAQTAKETAESASKEAGEVRTEADSTKGKASFLKDEADAVAVRVAETESRVEEFEEQARKDREMVFDSQEKANKAKSKAEMASERVTEANELVTEILGFLNEAVKLDTRDLDLLERRLDEAYKKYEASNIERSTIELESARSWQQRQISLYEEELRLLRIEVDNIQEIKESLPDGCFRQSRIET
ncbi:Laminin subunit gamma-1 [Armadillidium nasatum]|uniref:Laminin subunit gamma-1 n=1 Tax=Armadillidium nasatum TaxID=96803 RepID=A0A5N5T8K7_9CRUS|nr:Laminin subunit gamma-1 [Armadillidium nasatum]